MPFKILFQTSLITLSLGLTACTQSQNETKKFDKIPIDLGQSKTRQTRTQKSGLSILQGYTNSTTAQFSVMHKKSQRPTFFIRSFENLANFKTKPVEVKRIEMPHSDWAISRVKVSRLSRGRNYRLEVWTKNKFQILDLREFSTLDLTSNKVKILMAGCFKLERSYRQAKMWKQALSHSPDLIVLNGDAVYASGRPGFWTSTNPETIWNDYVLWRQNLELYRQQRLTPTLATWDDGDYGEKDGDREFKFRDVSKTIFNAFFPQQPDGRSLVTGPGISRMFRGFGLDIFLMDARSFRSPKDSKAQTQWGYNQEQWLISKLRKSSNPAFIVQGDQFFGGHHPFESYEGQRPKSFLKLMNQIKQAPKPVAFFSGDRHLTELASLNPPEWPYPSFEFTTSALHAQTYKGTLKKHPNPRQVYGYDGIQNYGILEVTTQNKSAQVRIQAWATNSRKLYEQLYVLKR